MSTILRAFLENEKALKRYLSRFFPRAEDVDDVAQETFLRAFAAEAGQVVIAPRAFLFRVAKNLALNEKARLSHSLTQPLGDSAETAVISSMHEPGADDQLDGKRKLALFAEAVADLPPQCRRVFLLRKIHGLSQREIAQRLGVSIGTVEKHIALGLLRTSEFLELKGYAVGGRSKASGERMRRAADGIH